MSYAYYIVVSFLHSAMCRIIGYGNAYQRDSCVDLEVYRDLECLECLWLAVDSGFKKMESALDSNLIY